MGYQPQRVEPRFIDKNGQPLPPHAERVMAPQSYDPNRSTYAPPARSLWYHDDLLDPLRAILIDGMMSRPDLRSPQDVGCVDYDAL